MGWTSPAFVMYQPIGKSSFFKIIKMLVSEKVEDIGGTHLH